MKKVIKLFQIVLLVGLSIMFFGCAVPTQSKNYNCTQEADSFSFYYNNQKIADSGESIEFKKFDGVYTINEFKTESGNAITINTGYNLAKGDLEIVILDPDYKVLHTINLKSDKSYSFDTEKSGVYKIRLVGKKASGTASIDIKAAKQVEIKHKKLFD